MTESFDLRENVPLSGYSTIGLGGTARYFALCRSQEALLEALEFARSRSLNAQILGGGSNTLFADGGFNGIVVKVALRGISYRDEGAWCMVSAAAGEDWGPFVQECIQRGLAGLECLSGIPGAVGATPIQNVGAYGQEVAETIVTVDMLDRESSAAVSFTGPECAFGYRQSRFKGKDKGRYIVTGVTFRLQRNGIPSIRYPELRKYIESAIDLRALGSGRAALEAVAGAVVALRRKKSMVIDPSDPQTKSLGSFFTNPVLEEEAFARLRQQFGDVPSFPAEGGVKVPAAWLVEHAGFQRGYRLGGAAISANHALALVNLGTTTSELLGLAHRIQEGVQQHFGVALEMEPVVVPQT
jgi:UDP-N-acetylmuramate dehydrogenase